MYRVRYVKHITSPIFILSDLFSSRAPVSTSTRKRKVFKKFSWHFAMPPKCYELEERLRAVVERVLS